MSIQSFEASAPYRGLVSPRIHLGNVTLSGTEIRIPPGGLSPAAASLDSGSTAESRRNAFKGYTVDADLMRLAHPSAIFLHCLPAHRGEEVSNDVIEGKQSRVWDEAENRLHVQKALLATLMG